MLSVVYALHSKTTESNVGCNGLGDYGGDYGGFSHYIGEAFGCGVIFHLWKDKLVAEHGLVVATLDQSTAQALSNITDVEIGKFKYFDGPFFKLFFAKIIILNCFLQKTKVSFV